MRLIAVARKDTMVYNANRLIGRGVMCWHHDDGDEVMWYVVRLSRSEI